ncbi:DAK2 domain-containing protein [Actinophytocola glycyrrhizae]|uniref:DAK2 domain-containing protein n=1 Tax=Actinophytocola glycyrrhizae TaxID=2044873 RepID=A0ABV9S471_9PSEU
MLQALDAAQVRRWAVACVQALDAHREAIDSINVYPVADGDTGSNLLHTMRAALDALLRAPARARTDAGAAVSVLARGALTGARGNSGVIVSQFLRGSADALADVGAVLGPGLRAALTSGAERARAAMAEPVPGTMITVFEAAARAARDESSDALQDVAAAAATAAAAALAETPRQLAVLAEAGVVDAGGRGVVVLFDALLAVLTGQPAALAAAQRATEERVVRPQESSLYTSRESGSDAFAYEVMYLLEQVADEHAADGLRDTLVGLGDSVSVVGDGDGLWTVHVHCNDIGAAIEAGVDAGRPRQIRVARFADAPSAESNRFAKDRAVVVPSRSTEFTDLLISEGVTVCRVGDDDGDGAAHRLLATITGTSAAHVTVLPADPALVEAADEAAIRAVAAGQDVVVVPGASAVQVLAAVAVHDPRRRASDDVVAMAEAAAATRRGEVVVATEDAITWIGACEAGDVLGFADGEVVLIEPGPADVAALDRAATGVVSRMLTMGGELVTALLGAEASDELATELEDYLRRVHPETELVVYQGGQRDAVLVLGVE